MAFSGGVAGVFGADGENRDYEAADGTLADGFSITGFLNVIGSSLGANDNTAFYMRLGNNPDFSGAIIPLPTGSAMAGVGLLVVGTRRRRA
jgi:homoserine acetyltransferase